MVENNAIEVKNVSKDFPVCLERTSLVKSFMQKEGRKKAPAFIHALKNIHFSVKRAETFAIIGPNGSGKTTLLKIIAGILKSTRGQVFIDGKLTAFLQLGLGFQSDLTGLENIYLYGAFLGMTKREISERIVQIAAFSELDDFLGMKLKYFSTGMRSRLAFAIIMQTQADIILLDEFLTVGDIYFQEKCLAALKDLKQRGVTIVIVSQSLDSMSSFCQRGLLLDKGEQIIEGDIEVVVERYKSLHA